jgi:sucrose-6-phosphate hydrolase SacC (GH32 family)
MYVNKRNKSRYIALILTFVFSLTSVMNSGGILYAAEDLTSELPNAIQTLGLETQSTSGSVYEMQSTSGSVYEILNPGFETGNLEGWTIVEGKAFGPDSVSDETTWWAENIPYNQEGSYHLNGWKYPELEIGKLRSSTFELGGTGWISFKLGGGKNPELVYIEVCDADTGKVIARYGNTEFADVNFPNVDQGLHLANMAQYKANLSTHIGKDLYIQIVDSTWSDWGVIFADAFFTYHESEPSGGVLAQNKIAQYQIENPGFETGNLEGWSVVEGEAFGPNSVSDETTWWAENIPYNQEGSYHLNGWKYPESEIGKLRSSTFKLGGAGWITFKLGGGGNPQLVHVEVWDADADEVIARYGNTEFADKNFPNVDQGLRLANMVQYKADLSMYVGRNLYIKIVDDATEGWGAVFADAFFTCYGSEPSEGIIAQNRIIKEAPPVSEYEIVNPNFETGDLTGWTVVSGDYSKADVTNGTSYWGGSFNHQGNYHFLGKDDKLGVIKSSNFKLGGSGVIDFLIGGGNNLNSQYVALVKVDGDQELIKVTNSRFADATGESYNRMVLDASEHLGEEVYIKIVDDVAGPGWQHINVDDFRVYNTALVKINNPGFETGDLTGWSISGNAFDNAVTNIDKGQIGDYHLYGKNNSSDSTGSIESNVFKIAGNGTIEFIVSGTHDMNDVYVALIRINDGKELFRATGTGNDTYKKLLWQAEKYIGEDVVIKIVDQSTAGYINVDDFRLNVSPTIYQEAYRPQYHFTPATMWMNDPNGMVYYNGEYHLFYQHHPDSTTWGPMHWGHAVSTNLVHWEHLPIALAPDETGMIFSGGAVVDWHDSSGFFNGGSGLVAFFTHAGTYPGTNISRQEQSIAYSSDNGRTWIKYEGNPVLRNPNIDPNNPTNAPSRAEHFRDPKVFWYGEKETGHWMMSLAVDNRIEFYTSSDLKQWTYASSFGADGYGSHTGVWECPDLIEMPLDEDGDGIAETSKWVLIVSLGAEDSVTAPVGEPTPAGGSGMMYFVGDFNGTTFTSEYPATNNGTALWADFGADFYAAVTWSDVPKADGRQLWLGWMSNWRYANSTPTSTWRSAMSIPRELQLVKNSEGVRLVQKPVEELKVLRLPSPLKTIQNQLVTSGNNLLQGLSGDTVEIIAEFTVDGQTTANEFGFKVRKGDGQETIIAYDKGNKELFVDRTNADNFAYHAAVKTKHTAPLSSINNKIKMHVFVDRSMVEVFGNDGLVSISDQIFPDPSSIGLELYADGSVTLNTLTIYELDTIWKTNGDIPTNPGSGNSGSGSTNTKAKPTVIDPTKDNTNKGDTPQPKVVRVNISLISGRASSEGINIKLFVKPYIENGRMMVGLRDVANMLQIENKDIVWNAADKSISIKSQDKLIKFIIGQKYAIVNGQKVDLDVVPQIKQGRTVLPVAYITRLLNIETLFNSETKEVTFIIKR